MYYTPDQTAANLAYRTKIVNLIVNFLESKGVSVTSRSRSGHSVTTEHFTFYVQHMQRSYTAEADAPENYQVTATCDYARGGRKPVFRVNKNTEDKVLEKLEEMYAKLVQLHEQVVRDEQGRSAARKTAAEFYGNLKTIVAENPQYGVTLQDSMWSTRWVSSLGLSGDVDSHGVVIRDLTVTPGQFLRLLEALSNGSLDK